VGFHKSLPHGDFCPLTQAPHLSSLTKEVF